MGRYKSKVVYHKKLAVGSGVFFWIFFVLVDAILLKVIFLKTENCDLQTTSDKRL